MLSHGLRYPAVCPDIPATLRNVVIIYLFTLFLFRSEGLPPPTTKVVKLARRGGKVVQDCDVYIGRAINQGGWNLPTSKWHNPFRRADDSREAKEAAIARFEEHLLCSPLLLRDLHELRGKTLGCWCKTSPDVPCHGDVLKHYADSVF